MLIEIIDQNAAACLLNAIEQSNKLNTSLGVLHFKGSLFSEKPKVDDIIQLIRSVVEYRSSKLYMLEDGDFIITWMGRHKATLADLCKICYARYAPDSGQDSLHSYYDAIAHSEDIRLFCRQRLGLDQSPVTTAKPASETTNKPVTGVTTPENNVPLELSTEEIRDFQAARARRDQRKRYSVLIVEDQAFSRKLLMELIDRTCSCYGAATAAAALDHYWQEAPDIVFLDIELPDANGHELATVMNALDPDAYIVMVTANNQASDVLRARTNRAKGFIVKPYSRQKIMDSIDKFINDRKLTRSQGGRK